MHTRVFNSSDLCGRLAALGFLCPILGTLTSDTVALKPTSRQFGIYAQVEKCPILLEVLHTKKNGQVAKSAIIQLKGDSKASSISATSKNTPRSCQIFYRNLILSRNKVDNLLNSQ
jgi:hypothetical protein